jgi:protein phosphatase
VKIDVYGKSDVGRKREKNEDSFRVDLAKGLFIVADGMGGHLGGEFASRLAVKTVTEVLEKLEDPDATLAQELGPDRADPGVQLKYAIRIASSRIFEEASRNTGLRGMGTTLVILLIRNERGYFANVGDSRAYLFRRAQAVQLTVDHSLVEEQLRAGFITEKEVKNHRLKNIITRSVGFQHDVEADLVIRDLQPGDRFLLCSDGLTNLVEDKEILKIISRHPAQIACDKLIGLANRRGGDDNVTTVVVEVEAETP